MITSVPVVLDMLVTDVKGILMIAFLMPVSMEGIVWMAWIVSPANVLQGIQECAVRLTLMNVPPIHALHLGLKNVIPCLIMITVVSAGWDFLVRIVTLISMNVCHIPVKMELNVKMGLENIRASASRDIQG